MVPIGKRDIIRAFGNSWFEKQTEKGSEEFFLHRKIESGEKKWLIVDQNNKIRKRTKSKITLGKLLGCDDHIDQTYKEWEKIFNSPTKGGI